MSLCFIGRGYITRGQEGGFKFFKILMGVAHKGGRGMGV